jgi:hypothetical protein
VNEPIDRLLDEAADRIESVEMVLVEMLAKCSWAKVRLRRLSLRASAPCAEVCRATAPARPDARQDQRSV